MKVILDSQTSAKISDLLSSHDVTFEVNSDKGFNMSVVYYGDKCFNLIAIIDSEDANGLICKAEQDKLNTIFYCIETSEKLGSSLYERIDVQKERIIRYGGYCPKSALELCNFLKNMYCNCYIGCDSECGECKLFPGKTQKDLSEEEKSAWFNFRHSYFSSKHQFSFCE